MAAAAAACADDAGLVGAENCAYCGWSIGHFAPHGQAVHIGLCRIRRTSEDEDAPTSQDDAAMDLLDDSDNDDDKNDDAQADVAMDLPDDDKSMESADQSMFVVAADAFDPPHDSAPQVPAWHPFLSEADFQLAAKYCHNPGMSLAVVTDFIGISRLGPVKASTAQDLLAPLDDLPGLAYNVTEIHLPGTPEDAIYRLFHRDLVAAINFHLDRHQDKLIRPGFGPLPSAADWSVTELWQGSQYQQELRRFHTSYDADCLLLPLVLHSGL
jgi:hypothetical protein